jgi:hypothetical protein
MPFLFTIVRIFISPFVPSIAAPFVTFLSSPFLFSPISICALFLADLSFIALPCLSGPLFLSICATFPASIAAFVVLFISAISIIAIS